MKEKVNDADLPFACIVDFCRTPVVNGKALAEVIDAEVRMAG